MNIIKYKVGYYIHRDVSNGIQCKPCFFFESEQRKTLEDLNGYSHKDTKEFIMGIYKLLNGEKSWNGDDYNYVWSGGECLLFSSDEELTIATEIFSKDSIKASTIDVYNLLLNRMRLMENYPTEFILKMIISKMKDVLGLNGNKIYCYPNIHIELQISEDEIRKVVENKIFIFFDRNYFHQINFKD